MVEPGLVHEAVNHLLGLANRACE
jgi:hypothetical protein